MQIDYTDAGGSTSNQNPDDNGFGWVIMAGPPEHLTSMDKRDGSHWELFDCAAEKHAGRQTVKAVCMDETPGTNCDLIFNGGVENTVVELPHECGPGRYAVALSMETSVDHNIPEEMRKRLVKRGMSNPRVYDFTYEYDFSVLQGRDDKVIDIRIDFSTDPYYWGEVVNSPANKKRDMEIVVRDKYGGNWKRYMNDLFHEEKRNTRPEDLHILRKRWFSADVKAWLLKQLSVDEKWTLARHSVHVSPLKEMKKLRQAHR
jgi:chitinase